MATANSRDNQHTARIVSGKAAPAASTRALAARSRLEHAGFPIEALDAWHWRIGGFSYWPEVDMWRHPDGRLGADGLRGLIEALKVGL